MQNKAKLVLELFGEATARKPVENRANDARALRVGQPAVFEPARHHRSRSAMPETHCLRLNERNALLHRIGIIREQSVTQGNQLSFFERFETGCLCFHRERRRDAPNRYYAKPAFGLAEVGLFWPGLPCEDLGVILQKLQPVICLIKTQPLFCKRDPACKVRYADRVVDVSLKPGEVKTFGAGLE